MSIILVVTVFIIVLVLLKAGWELSWSLAAGAVCLGLFFGVPLKSMGLSGWRAVSHRSTLELAVMVSLILILSQFLAATGQFKRLLNSLQGVIGDIRVLFIALPALIGLLPMPGGAVFSAPMIQAAAESLHISHEKKSIMNYWFRHIWEYCCPLYPGLVLASQLAGIRIQKIMVCQFPLTLVALGSGLVILLWKRYGTSVSSGSLSRRTLTRIAIDISPIVSVVLLILLFRITLVLALLISIGLTLIINRVRLRDILPMVLQCKRVPSMVLMIFGIMVFKGMLADSGALGQMVSSLQEYRVPLVVMVSLLPFLVGMVTGITVGYVGITFPVIIPLVGINSPHLLAYLLLAFGCGFMGVMLSPVHLCLIISHEYFGASMGKGYRYLVPLAGLTMAGTWACFALYLKTGLG